ncbi:MAG: zinc ribbon domain-containing protein, partial [Myxococcota bacterium]
AVLSEKLIMPTYEYGCEACGHQWEAVQSMKDDPIRVCPKCGESKAKRAISGGMGFILKGGGWYSDLYSSAKPKDSAGSSSESSSSEASSSSSSSSDASSSSSSSSSSTSSSSSDD